MNIAIETSLAQKAPTGMGQYLISLLKAMAEIDKKTEFLLFHSSATWTGSDFGVNFKTVSYHMTGFQSLDIALRLPVLLKKHKVDLFHATCTTGAPPFSPVPVLSTVHDIYPLIASQNMSLKSRLFFRMLLKWTLKNSSFFITNSQFTSNELQRISSVPPEKMRHIYLAPCLVPEKNQRFSHDEPYILCTGALEKRKGQLFLLEAYIEALKQNPEIPPIIFIGPDRGELAHMKHIAAHVTDNVKFLSYVTDDELRRYYANASLFVFPSYYEGFGIPLLEAAAFRLPAICSDIPVFREIAGDYPLFLKHDKSLWVDAILRWHYDKSKSFPDIGRIPEYSWQRTAAETLESYAEVLGK